MAKADSGLPGRGKKKSWENPANDSEVQAFLYSRITQKANLLGWLCIYKRQLRKGIISMRQR